MYRRSVLAGALLLFACAVPRCVEAGKAAGQPEQPSWLTAAERAYLKKKDVIRIAPDPNFPPIEWFDKDGKYKGLGADFVALIQRELGVAFKVVHLRSWDDVLRAARDRDVDMLPAAANTELRRTYLDFAPAHLVLPGVILVRKSQAGDVTLDGLARKTVAIVAGYVWQEEVARDHKDVTIVPVDNVGAGLKMLSLGAVDAMIATLPVAIYYSDRLGIDNLRVGGETGYYTKLSFATRRDQPLLHDIVVKALNHIPEAEKTAVLRKWIRLDLPSVPFYETRIFWFTVAGGICVAGVVFVLGVFWNRSLVQNVNERTRELNEKAAVLEATFENIAQGISVVDAELNILAFNRNFLRLQGFPDGLFKVGDPFEAIIRYNAERGDYGEGDIDELVRDQVGRIRHVRRRFQRTMPDGTVLQITRNPLPDGGIVATYTDVTELQKTIAELELAKQNAEDANLAKTRFIAHMSHDLRTPLNAILGFSEAMATKIYGELGDRRYGEYVGIIYESGQHLIAMIDNILDLSRIERGMSPLVEEWVDMGRELEAARARCAPKEISGDFDRISVRVPDEALQLLADRQSVSKIVDNLLTNAIRYAGPGAEIELSWTANGRGEGILEVADTGVGIPADRIDEMMRPFTRQDEGGDNDPYMAPKVKGTGLGLYIVKTLAEANGADFTIVSERNRGMAARIVFPDSRLRQDPDRGDRMSATPAG